MVKGATFTFNQYQKPFINAIRILSKTEEALTLEKMLGEEQELVFAVILQNLLHPKNSNRVEAIKGGSYVELKTVEEARVFIQTLLENNLKNELMGIESACKNQSA
jgi:hypothetical protein